MTFDECLTLLIELVSDDFLVRHDASDNGIIKLSLLHPDGAEMILTVNNETQRNR